MENLRSITQYAKLKSVTVGTVHYWIKKEYLPYVNIAGKKFIDCNIQPKKVIK